MAKTIFSTLQSHGHQVEKVNIEESTRAPVLFPYKLILIGSPVEGGLGGRFPANLDAFIGRCTGFEGKKSAVFVLPKAFGTGKAMKRIMHRLEQKGSIVIDFRAIKNNPEAQAFAEKLGKKEK